MHPTLRLVSFGAILVSPLLACSGLAAPMLPRGLPSGTAFVTYVRSVPELRANWQHTPFAHTWAEPDVQKFLAPTREKLSAEMAEGLEKMQAETGLTVEELLGFFDGELMVAIADFGPYFRDEEQGNPQLVVAANIGGNRARIEELIAKEAEKNKEKEQEITEEFQGETLHITVPVVEAGEERREGEAWAIVGDLFLVAEPKALLQQVIANLKRGHSSDSLLEKPAFASILQRQPDADIIVYLNLESLVPALVEAARAREAAAMEAGRGPGNPLGLPIDLIVRGSGLDALTGVHLVGRVAQGATTFEFGLGWTEQRGLLRMLTYGDPPAPRPSFVPDTWMAVSSGRFSLPASYAALKDTLREVIPPIEQQMQQQIAGLNQALGIDLERDFIGSIGEELLQAQVVQTNPDGTTNALQPTTQILAVSLSNADAFRRAVAALMNLAGPIAQQIETREYLGETIQSFTPPTPNAPSLSCAITSSRLLFCIGSPTMLETAIQNQGGAASPIWSRPEVERALADLAPGACGISFTDARRTISMFLDVLSGMPAAAARQRGGEEDGGPALPWDPAAKPSPEVIGKHWSSLAGALYRERDGLRAVIRINHVE